MVEIILPVLHEISTYLHEIYYGIVFSSYNTLFFNLKKKKVTRQDQLRDRRNQRS